ncbi:hypothetical protein M758_8G024300 [Ceratodon purpureus]|nr:hypothetical protein M758_8G024300 [Ceratodon purpureus]
MSTKVRTMIVNATEQPLTMKVGNRNCFFRLASVKKGGEYAMELCMDWTYQEFMLEDKSDSGRKLFVNSDDCCDYERITVTESDGKLLVVRVPRKRFQSCEQTSTKKSKLTWRFWL